MAPRGRNACVRLREIREHEEVDAANHLVVDEPLHLRRRHRVAEYSERLGEREASAVLVHGRGGVARERVDPRRLRLSGGEELPPDDVHARHVHRAQRAQERSVAIPRRAFRQVVAVEMSTGDESVRLVPFADWIHEPLHEEIRDDIVVVYALCRRLGVEHVLAFDCERYANTKRLMPRTIW